MSSRHATRAFTAILSALPCLMPADGFSIIPMSNPALLSHVHQSTVGASGVYSSSLGPHSPLRVGESMGNLRPTRASRLQLQAKKGKKGGKPAAKKAPGGGGGGGGGDGMAAAKAAALAAESANLFDEEPTPVQAKAAPAPAKGEKTPAPEPTQKEKDATELRMEKFEAQMKDVVKREKSSKELDLRGVRLQKDAGMAPVEEEETLDDSFIKAVLRGEKTQSKKKKNDMLKTETGEELYMTEFAPGANISPYAQPDELDFDPLNPPLPSELAARQNPPQEDPMEMPLVSALDSPSKQTLYTPMDVPIQDDALFKIKSVFDSTPGVKAPGRVVDKNAGEKPPMSADDTPTLEEMIRRDREAIKASVNQGRPLIEVDSTANALDEVGESVATVVKRVVGVLLAVDFFVVIFFLGWLGVSIVYQFAFCGGLTKEGGPICANTLYTEWYALWTPVIQPALGILMAGNILQGTLNGLSGNKEEE